MTVYIGIDWSVNKHDICYMNEKGEVIQTEEIPHSIVGFVRMDNLRRQTGVDAKNCIVGLETSHNLLVDYLWEQGYGQIYVIPPNSVKSAQGRYRQSGAKNDAWDARLIADLLRTDQKRYTKWNPDLPVTREMRSAVSMLENLNQELVRNTNRLRAVLLRYYPEAAELFSRLNSLVALAFIEQYPSIEDANLMTYEEFKVFLRKNHHSQKRVWPKYYAQLQQPGMKAQDAVVEACKPHALSLVRILKVLIVEKKHWQNRLNDLYDQHPDKEIFASLPAAGEFLEPALLAKMGDDRERFPNPHVLQAVAGTCPVTYQSGRKRVVHYRWACDHQFRKIVQQWARLTIEVSPWAAGYYRSVRPRCSTTNDAIRRLANRWLEILWRLWYDRVPYDETYHLKRHALRSEMK